MIRRLKARRMAAGTLTSAKELLQPVGPEAVEVHARTLAVGGHLASTLVV
ncbi:hypothetical protein JK363_36535, partial [Streptomyces sp. 205]|nr:hypothetical protein [Streptomyces coffeae]